MTRNSGVSKVKLQAKLQMFEHVGKQFCLWNPARLDHAQAEHYVLLQKRPANFTLSQASTKNAVRVESRDGFGGAYSICALPGIPSCTDARYGA